MRKNSYQVIGTLVAAVMLFAGATASAGVSGTAKAQSTTIDSGTMYNQSFLIDGQELLYSAKNPIITDRAGNPLRNTWIRFDLTNEETKSWVGYDCYPNNILPSEYYKYTPTVAYMYADENGRYDHTNGGNTSGWKQIDGVWYYFNQNNFIIIDFWVDDNKYYVGANGAWVQDKVDDGSTDKKIVWKWDHNTLINTTINSTSTTNTTTTTTETNENGVQKLPKGYYSEYNGEKYGWWQQQLQHKDLSN